MQLGALNAAGLALRGFARRLRRFLLAAHLGFLALARLGHAAGFLFRPHAGFLVRHATGLFFHELALLLEQLGLARFRLELLATAMLFFLGETRLLRFLRFLDVLLPVLLFVLNARL